VSLEFVLQNLVHLGAMFYLVCFLFRDQILLRSFAIAGDFAYATYYFNVSSEPLWGAIMWTIPNVLINLAMISIILRDSRTTNFSDDELRLYRSLNEMAPGDFRKLVRIGTWNRATEAKLLATEGQPLESLHYVLEGSVDIEKNGRKIVVKPALFIGEIAYLKHSPATATVRVLPGTLYMSWNHVDLAKAQSKHDGLKNAIGAILNNDLADKLART
jgi:CRP-like cAMP-binding protein